MKKRIICLAATAFMLCGCGRMDMPMNAGIADNGSLVEIDLTKTDTTYAEIPEDTVITLEYDMPEQAPEEETPELDLAALFEGEYAESHSGRARITVVRNEGNNYSVSIHWSCSAVDECVWEMSGEFDGRQVLRYTNCVHSYRKYSDYGVYDEEIKYTDGSGYLKISQDGADAGLFWNDDTDGAGDGFWFVRQ